MDLAEFLLARIAEDEEHASMAPRPGTSVWDGAKWVPAQWSPARVLAECEAKRRIVEMAQQSERDLSDPFHSDDAIGVAGAWGVALRLLALPYADHPDYDQTWRPEEPEPDPFAPGTRVEVHEVPGGYIVFRAED